MTILRSALKAYCVTLAICLALITAVWIAAAAKRIERVVSGGNSCNKNGLPDSTVAEIQEYLLVKEAENDG